VLLILALLALLPLGVVGCAPGTPFGAQIQVADTPDKAFQDGRDKEEAAKKALESNRRDDATKLWGDTATYYQGVASKFKGSETGFRALVAHAKALEKQAEAQTPEGQTRNYTAAQNALRTALKQYPSAAFASNPSALEFRQRAQNDYNELVARMDVENSKSVYYKVMDFLVRMMGGDPILAITFIALAVNLATWPLVRKQMAQAKEFSRYQPELKKIQDKYKSDPQEMMQRRQAFMKEHGINEFAGCLPALAQWPITMLMYYVIVYYQFHFRYSNFAWVRPEVATASLTWPAPLTGIVAPNLSEQDLPLLFLYAAAMWVQAKLTPVTPNADPAVIEQQKMMANMMPIILLVTMLSWQPPAAFVLYWIISIVFGAGRYWFINRSLPTPAPLVLNPEGGDGAAASDAGDGIAKPLGPNPKLVSPKNRQAKRK
jgi:YidC/Oxa1 family membrane protein insertase